MPPSSQRGGLLPCPDGTNPISGGFEYDGIGEVYVSRREGSGWLAAARNYDPPGDPDATLTIYAHCTPLTIIEGSTSGQRLDSAFP